jgi:hypothetical protein
MTDPAEALARHRPILRYDRQEVYFADSAAEWTDNAQNELRTGSGALVAAASPAPGQAQLSLAFLAAGNYPGDRAPTAGDRVGAATKNYQEQARRLHADATYANQIYGRWAEGSDGRTWLQYWFFYFYNDYNLVGGLFPAGLHEGDWEMIQLRLDPGGDRPDLAVYAQHKHAGACHWDDVEVKGDRPVVYVARGSHASYFAPGHPWTGYWFDQTDGKGASPEVALHQVNDDPTYDWLLWPGHWGDTRPTGDPLDSESPTGPSRHGQWDDPHSLLATAQHFEAVQARRPAAPAVPPTPQGVSLFRVGGTLHVTYDAGAAPDLQPARLVVTVNSPDDPLPPVHRTVEIQAKSGTVDTGIPVREDWHYDASVSIADQDALASASAPASLVPE